MKDQKQQPEEGQHQSDPAQQQAEEKNNTFHEHQRIDEEGNELDPEDIK